MLALALLAAGRAPRPGAARSRSPRAASRLPRRPIAQPIRPSSRAGSRRSAGPIVTAVEIRSDAPLDESLDLEDLIEVEVGQPLDRARRPPHPAQPPGDAATPRSSSSTPATIRRAAAWWRSIVFRAVVQVEEVRIAGQLGLSRDDLRRAVPQGVAQPLSEERVVRGVYALQDLTRTTATSRRGSASPSRPTRCTGRAVVTYQVDSGPRAIVRTIAFDHPVAPFEPADPGQAAPAPARQAASAAARPARTPTASRTGSIRQRYGPARVDAPAEELDAQGQHRQAHLSDRDRPQDRRSGRSAPTRRRCAARVSSPSSARRATTRPWCSRPWAGSRATTSSRGITTSRSTPRRSATDGELQLTFRIDAGPGLHAREDRLPGQRADRRRRSCGRT